MNYRTLILAATLLASTGAVAAPAISPTSTSQDDLAALQLQERNDQRDRQAVASNVDALTTEIAKIKGGLADWRAFRKYFSTGGKWPTYQTVRNHWNSAVLVPEDMTDQNQLVAYLKDIERRDPQRNNIDRTQEDRLPLLCCFDIGDMVRGYLQWRNTPDKNSMEAQAFEYMHPLPSEQALEAKLPVTIKRLQQAQAELAAFDAKAALTIKLEKTIEDNIAAADAKAQAEQQAAQEKAAAEQAKAEKRDAAEKEAAAAEQAVKDAEADQAQAAQDRAAAEATAKIDAEAADKQAQAAAIRQKAAEARKAGAEALAKAKADTQAAAQKEQDAETAERIANAPAPPVKRTWYGVLDGQSSCVVLSQSPADVVETEQGKINDKGAQVDVTLPDGTFYSFFRTKEACERVLADAQDTRAKASQQLDQYR
jgi:hypothetical protein